MNLSLVDPFVLSQDYPENTTGSLRSGHTTTVRFNHKGDFLAAGRADGTVVIFDVETNGVARKLKGHVRQIQTLSWSRNGRYLLTSSQDWKCNIWDLKTGSVIRTIKFDAPVYVADMHPEYQYVQLIFAIPLLIENSLKFVVCLFGNQFLLVDATTPETEKFNLPSVPKQLRGPGETINEKEAAKNAKQTTTISIFTASGEHILSGTSRGNLNVIDVATRTIIYSTNICSGIIIYLRLTNSGRDLVINSVDRIIRTIQLPNLSVPDLDPDTIEFEIEHKFQDVVNKLSWNHVAFSSTGEYITASTYNNHDIYIWERNHGSLVKILEGPKEEHGVVEWHPHRPLIAACGLERGRIHIWSIIPQQRWSALAPDFVEVEENVEYIEHEDEFDIHPQEEIHKRRLDLEDEDVDVLTIEPVKGSVDATDAEAEVFNMPVQLDLADSESEEEFVSIGRGEMRRKSPSHQSSSNFLDTDMDDADEGSKKKKSRKR